MRCDGDQWLRLAAVIFRVHELTGDRHTVGYREVVIIQVVNTQNRKQVARTGTKTAPTILESPLNYGAAKDFLKAKQRHAAEVNTWCASSSEDVTP